MKSRDDRAPSARSRPLPLFATALGLAWASGCSYGGSGGYAGPVVVYESEPNDTAPQANGIGPVGPGDWIEIRGHVADFGPDLYDGFAFLAAEPCEVEISLAIDDPFADFDVCVFDPVLGQFVLCFESPFNPEVGSFAVLDPGVEFHLVVSSFLGASAYRLNVRVRELFLEAASAGERFSARGAGADPGADKASERAERESYSRSPDVSSGPSEDGRRLALYIELDAATGAVSRWEGTVLEPR